jgi:hypothetical protein
MTTPDQQPADERTAARDLDRAATQVRHQLEQRGVRVHDSDGPEELADLLTAVEQFERMVARRGGDSFTNSPQSSDPDHREFVVPRRGDDEDAPTYTQRVRTRTEQISIPGEG